MVTDGSTGGSSGEDRTEGQDRSDSEVAPVLELDDVFLALSHPRRRYLLYTLINESNEETLSELATKIAAWEHDKPTEEVTDDERKEVQVSLYHSHVPKLASLDILEYNAGTDSIVRATNTEQVQAVLDGAGAELDSRQEKHARQTESTTSTDNDDTSN